MAPGEVATLPPCVWISQWVIDSADQPRDFDQIVSAGFAKNRCHPIRRTPVDLFTMFLHDYIIVLWRWYFCYNQTKASSWGNGPTTLKRFSPGQAELVVGRARKVSRRNSLISMMSQHTSKIPSGYSRPRYYGRNHSAHGDAIQNVFPD